MKILLGMIAGALAGFSLVSFREEEPVGGLILAGCCAGAVWLLVTVHRWERT